MGAGPEARVEGEMMAGEETKNEAQRRFQALAAAALESLPAHALDELSESLLKRLDAELNKGGGAPASRARKRPRKTEADTAAIGEVEFW